MRAELAGALARVEEVEPELDPTCFVFGGVAFEICPAPGVRWSIGAEHRLFAGGYATSPVAGHVHCVVSPAPELAEGFTREITWEWDGDIARVSTGRVRAELRRLSDGKYAATAFVVPSEAGCSALVTALTAAVVNREGGFVLHAAGVEIDGRAVLFIGPSGAGKTTAANHCHGARWFARDRAVVYPTPLGWYAAGLAGGSDPVELTRSPHPLMPIGQLLRVRGASPHVLVRESGVLDALRDLRESVTSAELDRADEASTLDALTQLCGQVLVGQLSFPLGARVGDHMRAHARRGAR